MRQDLSNYRVPDRTSHAGLWLDKFIGSHARADTEARRRLTRQVAEGIGEPIGYVTYYQRWKESLSALNAIISEARALGRMVVGLGSESVLETAITLHRTYGTPYIPGSALKGLAASYARRRLGKDWFKEENPTRAYEIVFGRAEDAGYVTFYDALYRPNSGHDAGQGPRTLHTDVLTVHHPDYYQKSVAPADWDSPTPIPLLAATGRYLIALSADPAWEKWRDAAFEILKLALAEEGVGAKTSSGYGRLKLQ